MRWPARRNRYWLVFAVFVVAACGPLAASPTPTPDNRPASLVPSATILPFLPTQDAASSFGRSNPTTAALAAEGELDTAGLLTPTLLEPTAQYIPLQFFADDGTLLEVVFFGAALRPAPMILLLHDSSQDGEVWASYASQLQTLGYNVYLTDLRGRRDDPVDVDWLAVVSDVVTIVQNLSNTTAINTSQSTMIGIGTGATVALFACSQMATCTQAVAISPRPSLAGLDSSQLSGGYGQGRRLVLASADDDENGALMAADLNLLLGAGMTWQRFDSGGRGLDLLLNQPTLWTQIVTLLSS